MLTRARRTSYRSQRVRLTHLKTTRQGSQTKGMIETRRTRPLPGVPHSNKSTQLCSQTKLQNQEHLAPRSTQPLPGVPHSNKSTHRAPKSSRPLPGVPLQPEHPALLARSTALRPEHTALPNTGLQNCLLHQNHEYQFTTQQHTPRESKAEKFLCFLLDWYAILPTVEGAIAAVGRRLAQTHPGQDSQLRGNRK